MANKLNQTSLPLKIDQTEDCEILIVGGGVAGTAAAYEGLLAGRTVCMTEITDWIGGQITS
ncbi:MAG: FAD-dependent oxidoreductase, partial [Pseudanabaena sp.]